MPKPKKISYRLITKEDSRYAGMHRILSDLVHEHHSHLRDARIALAWHAGWKADVDGRVKLGMCRKASDLDRQLTNFDFIILLNKLFWTSLEVTDEQRKALLDHELCHAEVKLDAAGDPALDELGNIVYRTRKHDIEEFSAIVERHGLWKHDLEQFYAAIRRGPTLFDDDKSQKAKSRKRQDPEAEQPTAH